MISATLQIRLTCDECGAEKEMEFSVSESKSLHVPFVARSAARRLSNWTVERADPDSDGRDLCNECRRRVAA